MDLTFVISFRPENRYRYALYIMILNFAVLIFMVGWKLRKIQTMKMNIKDDETYKSEIEFYECTGFYLYDKVENTTTNTYSYKYHGL